MTTPGTLDQRLSSLLDQLSPAEQRVGRFIRDNREEALVASASSLGHQTNTSDATVIRTAKHLGFNGMNDLRRCLARELSAESSPARRLSKTLRMVGSDLSEAFDATLNIHQQAINHLRRDIGSKRFRSAIRYVVNARRVFIFGIGPSSAVADYFSVQLGRFGIESISLTQTGLLLADGLLRLREGDVLMIFAYGRVYAELSALLDQADRHAVKTILFSDSLISKLRERVDLALHVERGRAGMLSMHTATMALVEVLLVGIALIRPDQTMASLSSLNDLRARIVGRRMDLPNSRVDS